MPLNCELGFEVAPIEIGDVELRKLVNGVVTDA